MVINTEGHAFSSAATVFHEARTQPLIIPKDGTRQLRTAPETTKPSGSTDAGEKPGRPDGGHADPTPRPPHCDHPTQERATVCRALDSTTMTFAAQRTRRAHIASHTPHNSATTLPSPHESHHNHLPHMHSPHPQISTPATYPRRAKRRTYNLYGPHVPRHRAGLGGPEAGQAADAPRPRPRKRDPENPGHRHPTMRLAYHP